MTTTTNFSGYKQEGNPSSRVLRPPGGASSNIFGDPEQTPQQQVKQEQQKGAQQSRQQPSANPTSDAKQEYSRNKGRAQYNPITGEEYPADYGRQKTKEGQSAEQGTGDKKGEQETKEEDNKSKTPGTSPEASPTKPEESKSATPYFEKVRQPPGGKSSGLW